MRNAQKEKELKKSIIEKGTTQSGKDEVGVRRIKAYQTAEYMDETESSKRKSHEEARLSSPARLNLEARGTPDMFDLPLSPLEDNQVEGEESEEEDNPLLFVDVNLGPDKAERIVVYDGDTAESLADAFTEKHGLSEMMRGKLVALLETEIAGLLSKIEEETGSDFS